MDQITALHKRYAYLVAEYGLAVPIREPNTPWSVDHAQMVAKGLTEDGILHHGKDIVGGNNQLAGPWLWELTEEIECAIRSWYTGNDMAVFSGEFPTGTLNAQVCIFPEGYLILVNREIIQLLYDFVTVISAWRLEFTVDGFTVVPEKEALTEGFNDFVNSVSAIILHHLHKLPRNQANDHIRRLTDRAELRTKVKHLHRDSTDSLIFRVGFSAQVVKASLLFIIAHEYGHIISRHLSPTRTARIRMARGEFTVASKMIDQEREADDVANRILLSVLERRLGQGREVTFTRFIESILVFAGPLLFFCIDAAIKSVSSQTTSDSTQTHIEENDHPPPEERLDRQLQLFKPFRVNQNLFILADVYSSWLSPTLKEVPRAIKQLSTR